MRCNVRVTSVPYYVLFRIDFEDGAAADKTLPLAPTYPKITRVIAYSYCPFCLVFLMLLWSLLMLLFLDHRSLIIDHCLMLTFRVHWMILFLIII